MDTSTTPAANAEPSLGQRGQNVRAGGTGSLLGNWRLLEMSKLHLLNLSNTAAYTLAEQG